MPSGLQSNGQWLCQPCNELFDSWEALLAHKRTIRSSKVRNHIHCKHCGQDFKTGQAEFEHIKQFHPQDQQLVCPGCGQGPFARVSGLMGHIEGGQCSGLDIAVLDERREQRTEFSRRLQDFTDQPVRNNFTKYMAAPRTLGSTWLPKPEDGVPAAASPSGSAEDEAKPAIDAATADWGARDDLPSGETKREEGEEDGWAKWNSLTTAAAAVPMAAGLASDAKLITSMDVEHPDHPSFSAMKYYSPYIEQFTCPKLPCGKTFKKAGGLISHLRSEAHGNRTYRCPSCNRAFKSLKAIVSHAEQSSARCQVRESDNYVAFMDQLTAGVVDVSETPHDDGTIRYVSSGKSAGTTTDV
ncbi:hypothetical protein CDD83_7329 [Cordyceps sp. RAO-2017]|nr:hypothetical protein CDD83_7329 [Cordyceps sp. RAO-2017]